MGGGSGPSSSLDKSSSITRSDEANAPPTIIANVFMGRRLSLVRVVTIEFYTVNLTEKDSLRRKSATVVQKAKGPRDPIRYLSPERLQ
ncbi:hypothetical protein Pan216_55860 [Planctomycetes bacterium Pan216]|uniref:Uncharacterized protein n=1 Tax=Kolteria novifilia TaxID=2527975 RepID=A0A518BCI8_9BACT|nr:hypothetical protein Pan216_55860 [Planctomycetes bacterium Pan216]